MSRQFSNLSDHTKDLPCQSLEQESKIADHLTEAECRTFFKFFLSSKVNYVLLPLILLLLVASELTTVFYFRFLADYNHV